MMNRMSFHFYKNVIPAKAGIQNRINFEMDPRFRGDDIKRYGDDIKRCADENNGVCEEKAQSTIEFTFTVMVVMFLVYGLVMVFRWAGMDLANRRVLQDKTLTNNVDPYVELSSGDDVVLPLGAIYHGSVTNGNTQINGNF